MEPYKQPLPISRTWGSRVIARQHRHKLRGSLTMALAGALVVLVACVTGADTLPILAASVWTLGAAALSTYHLSKL